MDRHFKGIQGLRGWRKRGESAGPCPWAAVDGKSQNAPFPGKSTLGRGEQVGYQAACPTGHHPQLPPRAPKVKRWVRAVGSLQLAAL